MKIIRKTIPNHYSISWSGSFLISGSFSCNYGYSYSNTNALFPVSRSWNFDKINSQKR